MYDKKTRESVQRLHEQKEKVLTVMSTKSARNLINLHMKGYHKWRLKTT